MSPKTLEIVSYNVNGVRAATKKGLLDWIDENQFDIICLQETKARPEQVDLGAIEALGYHHNWVSAEKKGYSGVAIFSKEKPDQVIEGCGIEKYDFEGRFIRADFGPLTVVSVYVPSGSSGDARQAVKMEFLDDFLVWLKKLKEERPLTVVSGDYNICNKEIDIHNPKSNKKTSGFLPEERAWMDVLFEESGYIDTFRHFNKDPHHYSWWSYRANARANNKGWRIDYHAATSDLEPHLADAKIFPDIVHSDHCPIYLKLKL